MNDSELVRELKDVRYYVQSCIGAYPDYVMTIAARAIDKIDSILSRHKEQEPLAVLADRKGLMVERINHYVISKIWEVVLKDKTIKSELAFSLFNGKTYPEAESKAREYLNSLPDKK